MHHCLREFQLQGLHINSVTDSVHVLQWQLAETLLGKRDCHQAIQRAERDHYNVLVADAKRNCDKVSMVAVDQSKAIYVPRLRPPLGGLSKKHRLEIRAGGGVNFSLGNAKIVFLSLASWGTTADVVCTQLFEIIYATITSDSAACRSRHLHIHADNAGAENKNQWVLAFVGWLLVLGWYDTAELSFLVVGHTANEIDSIVFSPMHKRASFENIMTIFDLVLKIQQSLGNKATVCWVESLYAWRRFFVQALPGLKNIMRARHFRFKLDGDGNPVVAARQYCGVSHSWGKAVPCLRRSDFTLSDGAFKMPQPVKNSLNPVFPQVKEGLQACLQVHRRARP